jgi:hypothetical protein
VGGILLGFCGKNVTIASMNRTSSTATPDRFYLKIRGKAVGISKAPDFELTTAAKDLELANPTSHLLAAIKAEVERRQRPFVQHNAE